MSHKTGGTLRLRNQAQVILWTGGPKGWGGISGQISDGRWENSRPHNHWVPWCSCSVVVAEGISHLGRNFYAQRDGYCFTEKDLLSIVGDEWLKAVQVTVDPDYTWDDMLKDLRDIRKIIKMVNQDPDAQPGPDEVDAAGDPVTLESWKTDPANPFAFIEQQLLNASDPEPPAKTPEPPELKTELVDALPDPPLTWENATSLAKKTVSTSMSTVIDYLLASGVDPTDNETWQAAWQMYLTALAADVKERLS